MARIHFTVQGEGSPVILLHGFPFNSTIWHEFAALLATSFKVYTPDLPGFGQSAALEKIFTIDDVADAMLAWITNNGIESPALLGHSLGGYVSLAIINKSPTIFSRLVLLNSTALADSDEKKASRNKVIDFIDANGVNAFTSNFLEPLFREKSNPAITKVREIAMAAKTDPVKGYTMAMRDRPNREYTLQTFEKPILFITGAHDAGISVESIERQAAISPMISVKILRDSAHMSMFEQTSETLSLVKNFLQQSNQP